MKKRSSSVDRISSLPDSIIIHHIFSFMEVREVIQTSILAKKWRHLWKYTPFLNLHLTSNEPGMFLSLTDNYHIPSSPDIFKRKWFTNFVDRVLIFRDGSSAIHKFNITSELALDSGDLFTWLTGALRRNVRVLRLRLTAADQLFELPQEVFTSKIVVLKVNVVLGGFGVLLPNAFCSAAKIKTLGLEYVKLPEGNSKGELVLSCPHLRKLTMLSCEDAHLKIFTISAVLLEKLKFYNEYASPCKIHIRGPNLTSIALFSCVFPISGGYSIENLSALATADINISRSSVEMKEVHEQCLIEVLKGVRNVNSLKLSASALKGITDCPNISKMLPNLLRNLRDVILEERYYNMTSTSAMASLLQSLPCIQSFVWDRTKCEPHSLMEIDKDQGEGLPEECTLYGVKTVEIRNPLGVEDELKFLEFLLKKAIALKEMIITKTKDRTMFEEFSKKLLALPRASSTVLIRCT